MKRIAIASGVLEVTAELDAAGRLTAVRLPTKPPHGLDTASLAGVLTALEKYEHAEDGPPFLRAAWQRMRDIAWGQAMTYGELATALGNPRASRAVGQACARNQRLLIVPCHRVLAETGLGGFALGLEWKEKLLELETEPRG